MRARLELAVETDGVFANPFDPAEADLWVTFTSPQGEAVAVPAFWYQAFDPATLLPVDEPGWRVRFNPGAAGEWTAQARLAQPDLQSEPVTLTVAEDPAAPGFVRIHPENPRYFAYDDGSFYFPVGVNLSWSTGDVLADYTRWLDRFSANGGNLVRVWMASWSFGLEWKDTGLGNYSMRLKQAWLLDQVFALAEARGVTVMLCLINHGAFNTQTNPEWSDNPYNAALGGPLQNPQDFVTDPTARDYFKRRLRYIGARWAASPALFAWEWWNEINWTPIAEAELRPWLTEMTAYLQTVDPYQHLITHSTSGGAAGIWNAPELQIAQLHDYSGRNLAQTLPAAYQAFMEVAPDKPVLMGEFGTSASGEANPYSQEPIHLHTGLWAAPFSGFAGTGMLWWWDNYIDPLDQWGQYRGPAEFFRGEEPAVLTPTRGMVPAGGATALLLQNETRVLGWLHSSDYTIQGAQQAYEKALRDKLVTADWKFAPAVRSGLTVTLNGLQDGGYNLSWFDPQTATWGATETITVTGGVAVVVVPDFDRDLAFKVESRQ